MLESMFLSLFGFAVFLCALSAFDRDEMAWPILSFVIWIVLALTAYQIDIPYAFLASDNTVVEHVTTYGGGIWFSYIFVGMALAFLIITVGRSFEARKEKMVKE